MPAGSGAVKLVDEAVAKAPVEGPLVALATAFLDMLLPLTLPGATESNGC